MWIILTDADTGQACYVRASSVQAILMLSPTMTELMLAGCDSFAVREAPWKVAAMVRDKELGIPSPAAGREVSE